MAWFMSGMYWAEGDVMELNELIQKNSIFKLSAL